MRAITIAGLLLLVAACGGRDARPVQAWSPYDKDMTCEQVGYEIESNNRAILARADELEEAKAGNVMIGVVGAVLFWPALFALDTTDTENIEIRAYQQRNQNLATVASDKGCNDVTEPLKIVDEVPAAGEKEQIAYEAGTFDGNWQGTATRAFGSDCPESYEIRVAVADSNIQGQLVPIGSAGYDESRAIDIDGKIDETGSLVDLAASGEVPVTLDGSSFGEDSFKGTWLSPKPANSIKEDCRGNFRFYRGQTG